MTDALETLPIASDQGLTFTYVSPTLATTQEHTNGIPCDPEFLLYPRGVREEEIKARVENLRKRLRGLPYFPIDTEGRWFISSLLLTDYQ